MLDHLGSVAEITNSSGTLDVPENFAAFGERRDPTDWSGPPSAADKTAIAGITQRGYTFHTNAEESSLIHMNGRIADSLTGRFLSPDPYVFQPHLTQSFNRYSYVNNNPLSFTDPSGFCIEPYISCPGAIVASAFSYIGSKLFGRKKLPPPKGCFVTGGGIACYGKAFATKLYDIARDVYGLPRLGAPPIWGVGNGTFGSCPGGWGPGCMSWGDEAITNTEVLPAGGSRGLTVGEISLARSVFGDAIDYSVVRIIRKKYFAFQPKDITMAPEGSIYFHPDSSNYSDDFSQTYGNWYKGHFIHEMTHIWQHQQGINVRKAVFDRRYKYTLEPGKALDQYGLEQQGNIVRDYFKLLQSPGGGPEFERYRDILPFECIATGEC